MKIIPRDYQEAAHDSLYTYFSTHPQGNPLIAMPTGSGKAVVIGMFIERALKWFPGQRILVLTHVKELIQQNFSKLKAMWPYAPAGLYSSGLNKREHHFPVTFAGIQSIHNRATQFGHHDIIIIDEAHLIGEGDSTRYLTFLAKMKEINPQLKIIGLTATHYRVGMGYLTNGKIFTDVCFDLCTLEGFNWLLNEGYLKPLIPQPTDTTFDLEGVHTRKGDFVEGELQEAVDKPDLNKLVCQEMGDLAHNRKHWLVFASGVNHTIHIADLLDSMGIRAIAIHSKMGDTARDNAIEAYKAGYYQAAVNNMVLTTGFDFPEIDYIGVLRPSKSVPLWVQLLGRGTRPVYAPGFNLRDRMGRLESIWTSGVHNCLVSDFARNTPRLGPINDPVIPKQKGAGGGGGEAPVKECPHCGTYVHASVTICPYCNGDIPRYIKITAEASTEELIKTTPNEAPKVATIESFEVVRVTYQRHTKIGRPDSLKVCYYTGNMYRRFEEWVCLEHDGVPQRRARAWWKSRSPSTSVPATISEALELLGTLEEPKEIRVRTDLKFQEIVGYDKFIQRRDQAVTVPSGAGDPVPQEAG